MLLLKQSTAIDIGIGPFVDSTDGVTPKTGLSITQAEVRLKKNATSWAQKNQSSTGTHEEEGWYEISLDTTDTDTLGIMIVAVYVTGALPVWREFLVVTSDVYALLVDGTDVTTYQAKLWLFDDNGGTTDRYAAVWYKNGQPITSGITSPQINVIKVADGTDLIGATSMTEIASLGMYRYDGTGGSRIVSGVAYIAKITATIDGSTRTFYQPVGRDST